MSSSPSSREVLFRNPRPPGDPRHAQAGEEALEALLAGTDAEGFAGDRVLVAQARERLAVWLPGGRPTIGEAYRLRNADRVEVLFLEVSRNPRPLPGLPGSWAVGLLHAIEVTRANHLAFRTSLSLRREDRDGWILCDPGDGPAIPRSAGREALLVAQESSLVRGIAERSRWLFALEKVRDAAVDPVAALRTTCLPATVRDRAKPRNALRALVGDLAAGLASEATASDREEGEGYARAAGRLVLEQAAAAAAAAPVPARGKAGRAGKAGSEGRTGKTGKARA